MATGRKGSRRIVVDGTTYRWRLRRRHQALCDRPCTYAVQHADTLMMKAQPGARKAVDRVFRPIQPGTRKECPLATPHRFNWQSAGTALRGSSGPS
ncbi:hypothetical protein E4U92_31160 [Streptomyces galbus]|uniref:Uncharacterized protein n=1 Tax=Streptomyces galbus TaxID=33898 RepID=A0A4U5W964_STRGB|nr:hypothetical protein E4U92_31160 [Streptomyces galbus]